MRPHVSHVSHSPVAGGQPLNLREANDRGRRHGALRLGVLLVIGLAGHSAASRFSDGQPTAALVYVIGAAFFMLGYWLLED